MSAIVDQILIAAEEALGHPLALPIAVGILTVLATVALFFNVAKSGQKQKRRRRSSKVEPVAAGGTTTVDGVRRSTRAHKTTSKYEIEEVVATPAPRKTPAKPSMGGLGRRSRKQLALDGGTIARPPPRAASPPPSFLPDAQKTSASKEAVTVSPKKRGRPAKSPAVAPTPVADSQPTTPRRRGRPRKSQ